MEQPKSMQPCSSYTADDFRPIRTIGSGDIGTVSLAVLRNTNQYFAVKVMKKEILEARKSGYRVETEREILSMLKHPFLPSLHSYFVSEKYIYIVMDYCPGGDLNILRQVQPEKKFSEAATRFYAAEVLVALEYVHKMGIVYRDLKPENVLIQQNGHIMLVDFDLSLILAKKLNPEDQKLRTRKMKNQSRSLFACFSQKRDIFEPRDKNSSKERTFVSRVFPLEIYGRKKVLKRPSSTNLLSYSFVGTDEYLAPEILWRTGHGLAVDWWTFGVFLYEMAYGITPFKGGTRKETFFNILCREPVMSSPCIALNDLISKLLVKEPDERFGSVNGSAQIKGHEFFHGVQWDELEYICRPPFLPSLLSLEEIDKGDIGQEPVLVESAYDTLALQSTSMNLETSYSLNDLKTSAGGLLEADISGRHIESEVHQHFSRGASQSAQGGILSALVIEDNINKK